jgi:hypothetical protein
MLFRDIFRRIINLTTAAWTMRSSPPPFHPPPPAAQISRPTRERSRAANDAFTRHTAARAIRGGFPERKKRKESRASEGVLKASRLHFGWRLLFSGRKMPRRGNEIPPPPPPTPQPPSPGKVPRLKRPVVRGTRFLALVMSVIVDRYCRPMTLSSRRRLDFPRNRRRSVDGRSCVVPCDCNASAAIFDGSRFRRSRMRNVRMSERKARAWRGTRMRQSSVRDDSLAFAHPVAFTRREFTAGERSTVRASPFRDSSDSTITRSLAPSLQLRV